MRDLKKYREAQKRAMFLLEALQCSVSMGFMQQAQQDYKALGPVIAEMQMQLGVKGPQCLPSAVQVCNFDEFVGPHERKKR